MAEILVVAFLVLVGVGAWWFRRWSQHEVAVRRMPESEAEEHVRVIRVEPVRPWWTQVLPWLLGGTGFFVAYTFAPLGVVFATSIGFLLFVVGSLLGSLITSRRTIKIESQLSEAIDHVVTSLHAGIGIVDALTKAEMDMKRPLQPQIAHLLMRLRLGDDPAEVCRDMAGILPLESFRIFYYALGVQWEGGGNLAPTLATTGRFIRERVDLGRRIRARSTEARFSVFVVLGLTYLLAALMWNIDGARVEGFLMTEIGEKMVSGAIVLQAVGSYWISKLAGVEY